MNERKKIENIQHHLSKDEIEKILSKPTVMSKESVYLLQKIDCNCNDCFFMERDFERFQKSLVFHERMQQDQFDGVKRRLIENSNEWKNRAKKIKKNEDISWQGKTKAERDEEVASCIKKSEYPLKEANKMKFAFNKAAAHINYGNCSKLCKAVSFMPNILQLDTQECFEHRVDHLDEETRKKRLGL